MQESEELARARLAFISAGQPPLGAPRRAAGEAEGELATPKVAPEVHEGRGAGAWSRGARAATRLVTRQHALVVGALLVVVIGVTVFALGQSAATEIPIEPVQVSGPPPPIQSSTPTPMLRVHVAGEVARPGVVTVSAGSIVQDAIVAAGGLTAAAGPAELNLAAPVSDGMQILIGSADDPLGVVSTPAGAAGQSGADGKVNLNTASVQQLEELPGVGPVMAASIVAWRDEHGGFTAVEELQEISGIGPKTFAKLAALVTI